MNKMLLLFISLIAAGVVVLSCSGSGINRTTVPSLHLNQFLGKWYEIARFDNSFERNLIDVVAQYEMDEKGRLVIINSGLDSKTGEQKIRRAKGKFTKDPGRLRVAFFWNFYSDYNILERGERGDWMLVGSRSPRYLWILARTPQLPEAELAQIINLARLRGYDTNKLLFEFPEEGK